HQGDELCAFRTMLVRVLEDLLHEGVERLVDVGGVRGVGVLGVGHAGRSIASDLAATSLLRSTAACPARGGPEDPARCGGRTRGWCSRWRLASPGPPLLPPTRATRTAFHRRPAARTGRAAAASPR